MFKNILIPTDGSEFSERVLQPTLELARATHARITGVHVCPKHHISPYGEFGPNDDVVQAQVREHNVADATNFLDRIEAAAKAAGVPCDRVIVENDDPWKGVLESARDRGCDLIVMATHDRHGLSTLLGSQTNKVLSHTSLPVLVYH